MEGAAMTDTPVVRMPAMTAQLEAAWQALFEIHAAMPHHWTLVGGQMVHLQCAERGAAPSRPTDDLDTALDVRTDPDALLHFTTHLTKLGFAIDGTSADGFQHRWVRDQVQIDVVIPTGLGERAATKQGAMGAPTVASPGAQQALDRSSTVVVELAGGITGQVNRPSLLGALVVKAAALSTTGPNKERHMLDFLVLCGLIGGPGDLAGVTRRDRQHLDPMIATLEKRPDLVAQVEGGQEALSDLTARIERSRNTSRRPASPAATAEDYFGRI
jgi:hypothetical protein